MSVEKWIYLDCIIREFTDLVTLGGHKEHTFHAGWGWLLGSGLTPAEQKTEQGTQNREW
jgi:hypothetical protein